MAFERNIVEINLDNFSHNLNQILSLLPANTSFMQIVKADAYGHGAYEIAQKSIQSGVSYFGVANAEEGALLRYRGIKTPILILSPSLTEEIAFILEQGLTPSVSSYQFAETLNQYAENDLKLTSSGSKIRIHIEIDTGMGRSGLYYKTALDEINRIRQLKHLEIEGVFSHYSSSENDNDYTCLQNKRFNAIIETITFPVKYLHIANSSGVVCNYRGNSNQLNVSDKLNMVRIGLLSYGVYSVPTLQRILDLKSVMSFKSTVCQIKTAHKGDSIGYNRTFTADKELRYAVIPVGYADGYDFLLSNRGSVLINNHLCPVIGKVSMDMITVDITDYIDISTGDEVILLGEGRLRAEHLVEKYDGLSYELLAQIGRRARRYYKENGEIVESSPLARRHFVPTDFKDSKLNVVIEAAISQRLQSKEIATLLYEDVLKRFFIDKDRNVHYRKNFIHKIEFKQPIDNNLADYYEVETILQFSKVLQQDYFIVACATRFEDLEKYFRRRDVEYRWLFDGNYSLDKELFNVTKVLVNNLELNVSYQSDNENIRNVTDSSRLELRCTHSGLNKLVGQEVDFLISTRTYYPKKSNQLSVYITELTKGVQVSFKYPDNLFTGVETVPIFSGQNKYPSIIKEAPNQIDVVSNPEEWIFPNSGIVFAYSK